MLPSNFPEAMGLERVERDLCTPGLEVKHEPDVDEHI